MNTPDIREQTLWLAALLHDIGKFYERAGGDSALPSDQAKAYQVRQLLRLIERYNLPIEGTG